MGGEFAEAEQSYPTAIEAGHQPQPGLALLRPAQGRIEAAAGVVRRAGAETQEPPARSRLLPAYVEIMLASGDVAAARAGAAEELGQIAELLDAPYLRAVAASAAGAVLLAEGDARSALPKLRVAGSGWRALDAPCETARVRVLIGLACRALGDPETSAMARGPHAARLSGLRGVCRDGLAAASLPFPHCLCAGGMPGWIASWVTRRSPRSTARTRHAAR